MILPRWVHQNGYMSASIVPEAIWGTRSNSSNWTCSQTARVVRSGGQSVQDAVIGIGLHPVGVDSAAILIPSELAQCPVAIDHYASGRESGQVVVASRHDHSPLPDTEIVCHYLACRNPIIHTAITQYNECFTSHWHGG